MVLLILLILLFMTLGGGRWGYPTYGYSSYSPLVILLMVVVILLLTGNLVL